MIIEFFPRNITRYPGNVLVYICLKYKIMGTKTLAVSALQGVGTGIVQKSANKAIDRLPPQKQNKVRGILMIAGAVALFVSGVKMMKKKAI